MVRSAGIVGLVAAVVLSVVGCAPQSPTGPSTAPSSPDCPAAGQSTTTTTTDASYSGGTARGLPAPSRPLGFHWVLGNALKLSDPLQMGLLDFNGQPLPAPDVYDI